jgi:hypothetical protein
VPIGVACWPRLQWAMISSSRCHFQVVSMFLFVTVHFNLKPELFQATSDRDSESNRDIMAPGDRPSHGDGDAAGQSDSVMTVTSSHCRYCQCR